MLFSKYYFQVKISFFAFVFSCFFSFFFRAFCFQMLYLAAFNLAIFSRSDSDGENTCYVFANAPC